MEKDYEEQNIVFQKCVLFSLGEDEELSDEFFITAPIDINDMYNQN